MLEPAQLRGPALSRYRDERFYGFSGVLSWVRGFNKRAVSPKASGRQETRRQGQAEGAKVKYVFFFAGIAIGTFIVAPILKNALIMSSIKRQVNSVVPASPAGGGEPATDRDRGAFQ